MTSFKLIFEIIFYTPSLVGLWIAVIVLPAYNIALYDVNVHYRGFYIEIFRRHNRMNASLPLNE